jgi:hypothetical protein
LIALEVVLGFAVPLGWGVWELLSLRRDRRRRQQVAEDAPKTHPVAPGHSPQGSDSPG